MAYTAKGEFEVGHGFGLPRKTTAQRTSYTPPFEGYMVYDVDLNLVHKWDGTTWIPDIKIEQVQERVARAGDTMSGILDMNNNDLTGLPSTPPTPTSAVALSYLTTQLDTKATAAQGALADTATQPNDDISTLNNDVGYLTQTTGDARYYTETEADGRFATTAQGVLADTALQNINALSIGELTDVDITTTSPVSGNAIVWNGTEFAPADVSVDLTNYVTLDGTQTITGTKTFTNVPLATNATVDADDDNSLVTKAYIEAKVANAAGAGVSVLDDLLDVAINSGALTSGNALIYDGTNFINRSIAKADITDFSDADYADAVHAHTKADITDFTETEYVHTTGDETVAGIKTFTGGITVQGDFTVEGTTTHVNSTNLDVADSVITVNKGETGAGATAPTEAGIVVDRGTLTNSRLVWDETTDKWSIGLEGTTLAPIATVADLEETVYVGSFTTGSWSTAGGDNVLNVSQSVHGVPPGNTYTVAVFSKGIGDAPTKHVLIEYEMTANGDVTIRTAGAPFAGKLKISL